MDIKKQKSFVDVWIFVACIFAISFIASWLKAYRNAASALLFIPFLVGILAFAFQLFIRKQPLIELYSKAYPYRRLKVYGVISAILLFEFILVWGLHTKQILLLNEDLFLITIIFAGTIAYYHIFVRMKISLRFLFLAVLMPLISAGAALGLGNYFNILELILPIKKIADMVFFNSLYWILVSILIQVLCEEPAFRGYLMQRLLQKSEFKAIAYSSLIYAIWRMPFTFLPDSTWQATTLLFCGNLIMGLIFALLFIKGKNLLVAILCHGIIDGLRTSFFASSAYPGIRQYMRFLIPQGEIALVALWFTCLLIGLILLTIIPRKKFNVS
ncbi:MAG: CPBP family intramembrane metalloprotease [Candidatus Omnitrophica bacterium]|nr:CPBP family intramembrane metalloprotease [Candidatus Omnitrophota bacterium]